MGHDSHPGLSCIIVVSVRGVVFQHLIALVGALFKSFRYQRRLRIRRAERKAYYAKSLNLALCYVGFAESSKPLEAWRAGEAAFFCCAYDVVTDWRTFDPDARQIFENILRHESRFPEIPTMALSLYDSEKAQNLEHDGLSRGSVSFRLILKWMGCEKRREQVWGDLDHLGRLLQIVDDVLDLEYDLKANHLNCLKSTNRERHLEMLISDMDAGMVKSLFGGEAFILNRVIGTARTKAIQMLGERSEREAFLAKLMKDKRLAEDLKYAAVIEKRRTEPTISLDDYLTSREDSSQWAAKSDRRKTRHIK